jgi:carbon-monoxide dehydrogenase iron sulfur subunit
MFVEAAGGFAVPLQCRHCDEAPCARVCPSGALSRPSEGEPVLIDQEKCIGCGFCVQACPFGVIRLAPSPSKNTKAVIKCDLCIGRQAEGLEPACVAACPVKALAFVEVEEDAKQARRAAASDLARASLHVVRPEG